MVVDPCIPASWPGFKVTRRFRGTNYHIEVKNPSGVCRGVKTMRVNGKTVAGNVIPPGTGDVRVEIELGK